LQSPALLAARAYVACVFYISGLTKLRDWDITVALFTDEYKVPLLSPSAAAFMGSADKDPVAIPLQNAWSLRSLSR
jgi:putative oxidoreductase